MTAIICTELYPLEPKRTGEGLTTAVRELVEGALAHGADIRQVIRFQPLLTPAGWTRPRTRQAGPLPVIDVPRMGTRHIFSPRLTRFALARAGRVQAANVVVCHTAASFAIAQRTLAAPGRRFIFVVHASDLGHPDLAFARAHADAVYCRSEAIRKRLLSAHGIDADGVVYSGVASSDYCAPARDFTGKNLKIVIATRLIPLRNVPATISALSLLRNEIDFDVDIYGNGELYGQISKLIDILGLSHVIRMHGFRPRNEVLAAMRAAHMFIMPSAPETFGLAYLEAMAQGCVVIGHEGWGIDGIVEDGLNGYLVSSARPADIAEKVLAYMRSSRERIHDASYQTAIRFTADSAGRNYAEMIKLHHF